MFVRVVRFTDVSQDRVDAVVARVNEAEGPPEGVPSTGIQLLHDESQGTAVVLQLYETAEDMQTGDATFRAMDAGDTPGTRVSIDMCELKLDRHATG